MSFFDWHSPWLWKIKGFAKRFKCCMIQVHLTFWRDIFAFIITIVGFKLEIPKKKKKISGKIFLSNYENYVFLWSEKKCWSKIFFPSTPKIRSQKDKSLAKVFTTAFHKVKSNLVLAHISGTQTFLNMGFVQEHNK